MVHLRHGLNPPQRLPSELFLKLLIHQLLNIDLGLDPDKLHVGCVNEGSAVLLYHHHLAILHVHFRLAGPAAVVYNSNPVIGDTLAGEMVEGGGRLL